MTMGRYLVKSSREEPTATDHGRAMSWTTLEAALFDARTRVHGGCWDRVQVEDESGQVVWTWKKGEKPR